MSVHPASPYKGLNAFEDSDLDALLFFGREREREIVVANLIASRLTVLYGPSGVGKSSLLSAGVARALRDLPEQPVVAVFSKWGDDPARGLADAVAVAAQCQVGETVLDTLVAAQEGRDVYVILDQAEEYFLYHADDEGSGSFADALPRILASPVRVNVLISLREDSLAKLDRFTGHVPGLFANTLRLDRLDRAAAEAAIARPAQRFVELTGEPVTVEPALVARVLDEVGAGRIAPGLGGLGAVGESRDVERIEAPYLQLVMQRLWEEERSAGSSALRAETLERLGGAQRIVEEHLEGAMDALSPAQKDVASKLFNHLVTPSGTKIAHEVSDLADFGDVSVDEVHPVLDVLAQRRILRSLEEGGALRYEIFHDVLANPVLAWRARHRTERAIEREIEERGRRRARLQRGLALGVVALVVLATLAGFALVQRANADEKARDAQARKLDAAAVTLLSTDPELGLLLARESAELSPGPVAEDALRQALLASRVRGLIHTGGDIEDVEISPDGRRVAIAGDGRVVVQDVESGAELVVVETGAGARVSFSQRSDAVLVAGDASAPAYVDLRTGEARCVLGDRDRPAAHATIAGRHGVVVRNGRGFLWDLDDCTLSTTIEGLGATAVTAVASPDGRRVAFISGREARVVDPVSGGFLYRVQHPGAVTSLAFAANSGRVVTGGRDRLTRVWDGATGRLEREFEGPRGQILDVAIDPDGTLVAAASTDGTGRLWDAETGDVQGVLFGHTNFVESVEFDPDGEYLVTSSPDGTARTWAVNGRPIAVLSGHSGAVLDARFSPDGGTVITSGQDGTVRLWDGGTKRDLARAGAPAPSSPASEATSPDGRSTAQVDGSVVRVDHADGTSADLEGHELAVTSVAFSPDGRRLVSAGRDRNAILWDAESGNALRVLRGHFGTVSDAKFSPDGRWIVTAGPRSVGLWKASTGELVKLLGSPEGPFTAVGFLADSRSVVALSAGDVVSVYDCRICGSIPELVALADERLAATGRELTPEERELYFD